jgi:hypothetical protein
MGQANYQAILYGCMLTEEQEGTLFEKNLLAKFEPQPRSSYETEEKYLGYLLSSSDPVVADQGAGHVIAHTAMPLASLGDYVRREAADGLVEAKKNWKRLQEHLGAKGFKLKKGELLFVADYD